MCCRLKISWENQHGFRIMFFNLISNMYKILEWFNFSKVYYLWWNVVVFKQYEKRFKKISYKRVITEGCKGLKKLISTTSSRVNLISFSQFISLSRELQNWPGNLAPLVLKEYSLNFTFLPSYIHSMIFNIKVFSRCNPS